MTSRASSYRQSKLITKDKELVDIINEIRLQNPFYGIKRLKKALSNLNQLVSLNRLRRVSRLYNLKPKLYSKKHYKQRDRGLPDSRIPNLIKGVIITKPNQVWCADFTYLKFNHWFYLSTVIDVYTKEIVGFHLSTNHSTDLISIALKKAVLSYGTPSITHNDQGSEYTSFDYLDLVRSLGIVPSNSAKSSPCPFWNKIGVKRSDRRMDFKNSSMYFLFTK